MSQPSAALLGGGLAPLAPQQDTTDSNAPFDDTSLEAVLAKLSDAEVAEAAASQIPPSMPPSGTEKLEGPSSPGQDAGELDADGEEAVCAAHGKKRKLHYLAQQEDGTYTCVAPNLCKMPRPGMGNGLNNIGGVKSSPDSGALNGGPGRASPLTGVNQLCSPGDQSVLCRVHGKYRSARNMIRLDNGEFHCHPNFQCRIERGPGRKSPAGLPSHPGLGASGSSGVLQPPAAPGLARNSSSIASLASNISIGGGSVSFGQQPPGVTPPMQTVFAPPQVTQSGLTQYVVLPPGAPAPPPGPPSQMVTTLAPSGSSSSLLQAPVTYVQQPGGMVITQQQPPIPHPGLPANSSGQLQVQPQPVLTPSNSGQQLQQFQVAPNGQIQAIPQHPQQVAIVSGPPPPPPLQQQQQVPAPPPQYINGGVVPQQQPPQVQYQQQPPQQPIQYVQYAPPPNQQPPPSQ